MNINFEKNPDYLIPAIIQDAETHQVLMLGYQNKEAFEKTLELNKITFFSRTKQRLWTKGEESGHFLELLDYKIDCDQDTILYYVIPHGPTCHKGDDTCWGENNRMHYGFLSHLEKTIEKRKNSNSAKTSYVASLFKKGINKIAQKVGEEAVEVIIEAKDNNDDLFLNESADLLFHYLILLNAKGFQLDDIAEVLKKRHK